GSHDSLAAYMYGGQAVRTALAIGINREPQPGQNRDPMLAKTETRTWWITSTKQFAREMSSAVGRPDSLGADVYHNRHYPAIKGDPACCEQSPELMESPSCAMIKAMVDFTRIIKAVILGIYLADSTLDQAISKSRKIEQDLERWLENLPVEIRPNRNHVQARPLKATKDPQYAKKQRLVLKIRYHNVRILLFGFFLTRSSTLDREAALGLQDEFVKCVDSAKQTIEIIYEAYQYHDFFRTWFYNTMYTLFATSIILIYIPQESRQDELAYLYKLVEMAIEILEIMDESVVATQAAKMFQETLMRARTVVSGTREEVRAMELDKMISWPTQGVLFDFNEDDFSAGLPFPLGDPPAICHNEIREYEQKVVGIRLLMTKFRKGLFPSDPNLEKRDDMSDYTTATAMLEALESAGVTHLFVNLGSDHPAVMEAISKREKDGNTGLRFITAPNEMVGLSAAQGFFQTSNRMQAILVHVDAGTLAMGGAIHNVSRARIPVIMIAGTSPITDEGELIGSRNEFIHYIQDTVDQRGIVKNYTVLDHEIRSGKNVKQLVLRAAQFSQSDPQGPSYLIASRETLEESIDPYSVDVRKLKPVAPKALAPETVEEIGHALLNATSPVIITSYLGKTADAIPELITFAESVGAAVLEAVPSTMNFPHNHSLYVGNQWSDSLKNGVLEGADVIIVIDCDVPWVKSVFKPSAHAAIYHIDCDPLKVNMTLFHLDADVICQAAAKTALKQLNGWIARQDLSGHMESIEQRTARVSAVHDAYISGLDSLEGIPENDDIITPHYALSRVREHIDQQTIILSEGISNYRPIRDVLKRSLPGTYFTSGATSLGWCGGAAIGAKMANPDKTIVAICGDGSFLFSIPSSVHWMARKYDAPFLTIILNNRGWKSPMLSALAVHKAGYSSKTSSADALHITFDPPVDHAQVAVAAGAGYGVTVKKASELDSALKRGLETVKAGRAAVIDVWLPKFQVGDRVG
ncbi:hypothetical protein FALBO_12685, partial [Fusarium albosuccineum]